VTLTAGLEATLEALELGPEHEALIAYCRVLADHIDNDKDDAALWREYRPALMALLAFGESESDGQAALIELVRPPIRHTPATGA